MIAGNCCLSMVLLYFDILSLFESREPLYSIYYPWRYRSHILFVLSSEKWHALTCELTNLLTVWQWLHMCCTLSCCYRSMVLSAFLPFLLSSLHFREKANSNCKKLLRIVCVVCSSLQMTELELQKASKRYILKMKMHCAASVLGSSF